MKLTQNKILVILLMLVAFIGQAMASTTMSCVHESKDVDMSMMQHANMSETITMNHADMMLANSDQSSKMDCCQEQCKCPMSGCISLSLLIDTRFNYGVIAEQKISQLSSLHQPQVNSSLYRPPIS